MHVGSEDARDVFVDFDVGVFVDLFFTVFFKTLTAGVPVISFAAKKIFFANCNAKTMPSTKIILGIVVVVLLSLCSIMVYVSSRPKPPPIDIEPTDPVPKKKKRKPVPTAAPTTAPTAAPTAAPTTPPAMSNQTLVYADPYAGIVPPPHPFIFVPTMPTFVMVPGANMPGMVGRRRDEVTTYIMTRYPRLVVRAIPAGSPVAYDVRKDRITVAYDPYTNRVVTARVG